MYLPTAKRTNCRYQYMVIMSRNAYDYTCMILYIILHFGGVSIKYNCLQLKKIKNIYNIFINQVRLSVFVN